MILHAYTIYDRKALQYHAPFFAVADGAALRSFMDLANDPNTTVGRHPGDYVLYRCGAYDDASGELHRAALEHITDALPLVRYTPPLPFDPPAVDATRTAVPKPNGAPKPLEIQHERWCQYVTAEGPASCTCGAAA